MPKQTPPAPATQAGEADSSLTDDANAARTYLRQVMDDPGEKGDTRLRAALALASMEARRQRTVGVKQVRQERAAELSTGKYRPAEPPKLVRAK
jgi:hypothetical protein